MKLNGYQIVNEITLDTLKRALEKGQHDPWIIDKNFLNWRLAQRVNRAKNGVPYDMEMHKKWEAKMDRKLEQLNNFRRLIDKKEKELASRNKKIAIGAGVGLAAAGTAAYLYHRHKKNQEKVDKK